MPQSSHVLLPPALYVPASQLIFTLEPPHDEPAGQGLHAVRVISLGPDVYEPAAHVEHVAAPPLENVRSDPQLSQEVEPPELYVPAPQGEITCVPSQVLPPGHVLQLVRVRVPLKPPLVKLPVGHVRHASAPSEVWYALSAPHSVQAAAPVALNLPAGHCILVSKDPFGQAYPARQGVHCARVVALPPPFAKDPAAHVAQVLEPDEEYRVPLPQAAHVAPPGLATNSKCAFLYVFPTPV